MSGTTEYACWVNVIHRCTNPHHHDYADYGKRGIGVCDRWLKFENFYDDMGRKLTDKHVLERKDKSKGYSPENCLWSTRTRQQRNVSRNHVVTFTFDGQLINSVLVKSTENNLVVIAHDGDRLRLPENPAYRARVQQRLAEQGIVVDLSLPQKDDTHAATAD
jgi:hypothetical protein